MSAFFQPQVASVGSVEGWVTVGLGWETMMSRQQLLAVLREVLQRQQVSSLSSSRLLRVSQLRMMLELGLVRTHCWRVAQAPSNGSASTGMLLADARRPGGTALSQFRQTASTKGNRAVILNSSSSGGHCLISI
eukprot:1164077-Rhodomonas_salina.1